MDPFLFDMCTSKDIKLTRITANVECHKIMKNEHNGFSVLIYSCFGMYTRRPLDFYVFSFFSFVRTTFNGSNIHKSFWQSILLCKLFELLFFSFCFLPIALVCKGIGAGSKDGTVLFIHTPDLLFVRNRLTKLFNEIDHNL